MARLTHVNRVAESIGESRELIEAVTSNSDNIDHGEMIHVYDGTDKGMTTFTDRGVESLKELLADIRTWKGGLRQFLIDQQCEPETIERVMTNETKL